MAPKNTHEKNQKILSAWKTLRPDKAFSGMTVAEFERRISPSELARQTITDLENKLSAEQNKRDEADADAQVVAQAVVNAVKGDLTEGEDGELYEAMGYVRKSERKSGLHRSSKATLADTKRS